MHNLDHKVHILLRFMESATSVLFVYQKRETKGCEDGLTYGIVSKGTRSRRRRNPSFCFVSCVVSSILFVEIRERRLRLGVGVGPASASSGSCLLACLLLHTHLH